MSEIRFENDAIWMMMALAKLAARCEMLEQENMALQQQMEQNKGLRAVEAKEADDGLAE